MIARPRRRNRTPVQMNELDPYFDCDGHLLLEALALSATFGRPFCLDDIRAFEEKKKGLRPHQDAAIGLAQAISGASVNYDRTSIKFIPGPIRSGEFSAEVDGAGPISSVLQAALLPAIFAPGPVVLNVSGGTDVLYRPNLGYVEKVLLPYYRKFADISLKIDRRGIFPRGNGRVILKIEGQRMPSKPILIQPSTTPTTHLQVVGSAPNWDAILGSIQAGLTQPLKIEHLCPDLNVLSLCAWTEAKVDEWPATVGCWRVSDRSVLPKFGAKLADDFEDTITVWRHDPRVQLLSWLAGAPMQVTATSDSNELAATKYLAKALASL